ncbi:MAG: alkaline phosphatase D family protein [Isosphaeraceae bacterium]
MSESIDRREFLRGTTAGALGLVAVPGVARPAENAPTPGFASRWNLDPDRVWLGPEFWANPLQDWRLRNGRAECLRAAPDREIHLLTRQLGEGPGNLLMSVRVARTEGGALGEGGGSFGFRVGVIGPLREYRNSLIFGQGIDAGLCADGRLFIGDPASGTPGTVDLGREEVELRLIAETDDDDCLITLKAVDPNAGRLLGEVREVVPSNRLVGNLVLAVNYPAGGPARPAASKDAAQARTKTKTQTKAAAKKARAKGQGGEIPGGLGAFAFTDWRVSGSKVETHDDQVFGPVLFSQYTLSDRILKLSAQFPPLGPGDSPHARLQVDKGNGWETVAEAVIHPEARTATFRVETWDDTRDTPYRVAYALRDRDGKADERYWSGTVRHDPVERHELTVADVSCNAHYAFPNVDYVAQMARLDPDLIAFTGDQFYEPSGGYGVQRAPTDAAILDLLRKWYLHGWTWRLLTRDRPCLSIPDDHDVYQGNIWGEAGAARRGTQEMGGYEMPVPWVNVVHRTQTAHHPDPFDPEPTERGITVYFGSLTYGRVSFAVIADRQFKSGPQGKVPPTGGRGDHVKSADYDPRTADLPGLSLLGDRQMRFLQQWAADWRGADMKAVVSQTIFTAMATTHGGNRERLRADYDTNGWPQGPRDAALRAIRKAFAFHVAGDQHLPAVVQYGVETHGDAAVAFAGPAVNNLYPRWWEPGPENAPAAPGAKLGEFVDSFGHPLVVLAVANPKLTFRPEVLATEVDKASGLGLVQFDRRNREITVHCWPFLADPLKPGNEFPGWPVSVKQVQCYGRKAAAYLPPIKVEGVEYPVFQVVDESSDEIVYTIRSDGPEFRPFVFAPGSYLVRVSDPEAGRSRELSGLKAGDEAQPPRTIELS